MRKILMRTNLIFLVLSNTYTSERKIKLLYFHLVDFSSTMSLFNKKVEKSTIIHVAIVVFQWHGKFSYIKFLFNLKKFDFYRSI